jgi:hypothetical protein
MAFIWIFTIESHDRKSAADCKAGSQDDEEYDESRADLEAHVVSLLEDHRGLVLDVHRLLSVITARLVHCKLWWTFGRLYVRTAKQAVVSVGLGISGSSRDGEMQFGGNFPMLRQRYE